MIKNKRIQIACKIISFDVSSLFTMALLDYTFDLTFKQIYNNKEIKTKISRKDIIAIYQELSFHP